MHATALAVAWSLLLLWVFAVVVAAHSCVEGLLFVVYQGKYTVMWLSNAATSDY